MYRKKFQKGMVTIFFSVGSKPLDIWETHIKDGYITKFLDQDIKSMVYEIRGTNVSTTYINCPKGREVLGINLPFMVMIVKNLKKYFTFEVTILDNTGARRRFRVSNFQSTTQILPLCTVMPIGLADEWNQIQFNLAEFTRRAYNKQFVEVQNVKVNANIRLRRIYFTERLVHPDELPNEYKLFFPIDRKARKENIRQSQTIEKDMPKVNVSKISIREQDVKTSVTKTPSVRSIEREKKKSKESLKETMQDIPEEPIETFIKAILEDINKNVFNNLNLEEVGTEEVKTEEVAGTEELVGTEEAKIEEVGAEEVKAEEVKAEEVKAEQIKTEEAGTEEVKTEGGTEEARTEEN